MNNQQQIEKNFEYMTRKEKINFISKKVEIINNLSGKNYHLAKIELGYCLTEEPAGSSSRYRFVNKNLEDMKDTVFDILYTLYEVM